MLDARSRLGFTAVTINGKAKASAVFAAATTTGTYATVSGMTITHTPAPSPEPNSPHLPVWTPSQFKGARKAKARRGHELEDYSLGETIANAVSNGVGAALAVAALVILVVTAALHGGGARLLAALAFGVPMLLAFLMSTLYHALPQETPKRVFKVLGHDFVFLYMAGAFTPYCVLTIGNAVGMAVLGVEWLLAFAGILVESIWLNRPKWLPLALCVVMCCVGFALVPDLASALTPAGWWLLVAAVMSFAAGLVLYLFRKVPYLWFVSHLVVLAGSICLFLSVVLFVI